MAIAEITAHVLQIISPHGSLVGRFLTYLHYEHICSVISVSLTRRILCISALLYKRFYFLKIPIDMLLFTIAIEEKPPLIWIHTSPSFGRKAGRICVKSIGIISSRLTM